MDWFSESCLLLYGLFTQEAYTKTAEETPNKENSLTFKYMGPAQVP